VALAAIIVFFLVTAVQSLFAGTEIKPPPLVDSPTSANIAARPKVRPSLDEYAHLRNSKLFGALSSANVAPETVVEENLPETTLELELIGCVAEDGPRSWFRHYSRQEKALRRYLYGWGFHRG